MKVKTRKIPVNYTGLFDGKPVIVTFIEEETYLEKNIFKRIGSAFIKTNSWIYVIGILLQIGLLFIGNSSKASYASCFFWIGVFSNIIFCRILNYLIK